MATWGTWKSKEEGKEVKGKGVGFAEGNLAWHHKSKISDEDLSAMYAALGED